MSVHIHTEPTHLYRLPVGATKALLVPVRVGAGLRCYPDTGYEVDLDFLRTQCAITTFDTRHLPGLGRLWFDDEGRFKNPRDFNPLASILYETCYRNGEGIVGEAFLLVDPVGHVARSGIEEFVRTLEEHAQRGWREVPIYQAGIREMASALLHAGSSAQARAWTYDARTDEVCSPAGDRHQVGELSATREALHRTGFDDPDLVLALQRMRVADSGV